MWDIVVTQHNHLVAVLELKSHVGSFGNNVNNRAEEAIGSAIDLWTAFREGAFGESLRPFVGYFVIVEDAPKSRTLSRDINLAFPILPEFRNISYLDRYNILCRKLIQEQLYSAASMIASPPRAIETGEYTELSELTSLESFVTGLAGHIASASMRKSSS
jgi:hypothetical protein